MIIDCHTHAFVDKIADKVVNQLVNYYQIPTDNGGKLEDLLAVAAEANLDGLIMLTAATKREQVKPANDWALSFASDGSQPKQPGLTIVPFGTYHPDDEDWLTEVDRLRAAGIKGLKLHPEFQGFDLADPRLHDFFAEVERDFILLIHVGDPVVSQDNYSTPRKIARILDNFPNIRIIAAHLGGFCFWEEALNELAGRDVYLDTSSSLSYINENLLRKITTRHASERILFGSDYPLKKPAEELALLERISWLSAREMDLIRGINCQKLLGLG